MAERMVLMQQIKGQTSTHECPSCQSGAYCAMEDGKSANLCWCMTVPKDDNPISPVAGDRCLCRKCLIGE